MKYKLKELKQFVQLQDRALKTRMKLVVKKYVDKPELLKKNGRSWEIDESIIFEFEPKNISIKKYNFQSFISVSFADSLSLSIISKIIEVVYSDCKEFIDDGLVFYYTIEKNKSNNNHIHIITNTPVSYQQKFYNIFSIYSICNFKMTKIFDIKNLNTYLHKDFIYKKLLK